MTAVAVSCPHCGSDNEAGAAFCGHCGKALPSPTDNLGPRVIEGPALASTAAGRSLQSDELHKKAKSAAGALLAVAVLTTIGGVLLLVAGQFLVGEPEGQADEGVIQLLAIGTLGIAALYYGLWFWARRNPLPATLVGLVTYMSIIAINAAMDPATLIQGVLIKVIIIAVLIRGVRAGIQYRELQRAGNV